MAAQIYYSPFIPAFSSSGAPVPGAQLYFYYTSTLTKAPIWTTSSLSVPLTNPVVAAANGKYPDIYLDGTITYRVRQLDGNGNQIGDDIDPYVPGTAIMPTPPTVNVGTTTTLGTGVPATVTNAGTAQNAVFNFGIPTGPGGPAATVAVGTVSALPAGSTPVVTNVGTSSAAILNFSLAQGNDGVVGVRLTGNGIPANNYGNNGDTYVDLSTGIIYGPKSGGKWPLGTNADVNSATPNRYRSDFRIAGMTFPSAHWTLTRAGARTDMLYTDDYTYALTSFGSGVPMIRPGKGLGVFSPATQLLAAPGAPATETLTLNSGGTYIVTCWGPGGSAMGVATGTATATITKFSTGSAATSLGGTEKTFLTIVVTGTGTVIFTPSGGLTKANVILNSSAPGSTQPVPYIATQATIPGDLYAGTSTFNALIGATQGYFIVGVTDTNLRSYVNPSPFGLNGFSAVYLSNDTQYIMFDGTHSSSGQAIGNSKFSTGAALGRTWDATATVSNGAGDSQPFSFGFQHNNGAAVTSSALGVAATTGSFANYTHINGFISFYEIDTTARLSTSALYQKYTSWFAPSTIATPLSASTLHNFTSISLPKWKRGLAQMAAGVRDAVLCIVGSSHSAGQYPTNDAKRNSWPWQLATKLTAAGIQAWPYAYCGDDQYTIPAGGGTSVYDPYVSFSAGWSKSASRSSQFGGNVVLTTTTGATFTHAIPVATDSFTVTAYQGSGYGTFTINANGGSVLATVNCDNPTPGEIVTKVTVPAGVNSFAITVTSTGSKPVKIARTLPNDSRFKKVLIYNGARSAANSTDLANATAVENSYLLGLTNLAPDLTLIQGPVTNAAGAGESAATFTANMTTVYNTAAASGAVLMMDDPASSVAVVTLANQTLYRNLDATIAYDKGVPFLSAYEIGTYELGNLRGLYGDTVHGSTIDNGIIADNATSALVAAAV
jgi:hypothetical protein